MFRSGPSDFLRSVLRLCFPAYEGVGHDTQRRVAQLVIASGLAATFCIPVAVLLHGAGHQQSTLIAAAFALPFLLVPLTLRFTGSVVMAGHLLTGLVFAAIAIDFGPDNGFSLVALLVVPMMGAHLVGAMGGVIWTSLTVVFVLLQGPSLLGEERVSLEQLVKIVGVMAIAIGGGAITTQLLLRARTVDSARNEDRLRGFQDTMRRFIAHHFPGFMLLHDERVEYVDPRFEQIDGWHANHWIGRRFLDAVHPNDARELAHHFSVGIEHGFRAEARVRHADGHWVWVELYTVADPEPIGEEAVALRFHSVAGNPGRRWYMVLRDMSVDIQARDALSQADQQRGSALLAAGLAHDFNNLLTIIRGFGDLMAPGSERDAVLTATDEAMQLTDRLRQISGGGPDREAYQLLDLSAAVRDFEGILQRALGDSVTLTLYGFDQPLWVNGNVVELRQLLLNIAKNAGEALRSHSTGDASFTIELVFRSISSADLGLAVLAPGDYLMLKLRDNGPGMTPEQLERAFEPFFTTKPGAESAARESAGGVGTAGRGLGLASAHGIARAHGGTLNIASLPGRGTTLTLVLPAADPLADAVPRGLPSSAQPSTVLLCEDEDDVRRFVTTVLQRAGHEVLAAADTFTAERLAEEADRAPQLLVTDVMLPADRGPALARRLRKHLPELPVLYISGYTLDRLDADDLDRERSAFLAKPLRHGELLNSVETLLSS